MRMMRPTLDQIEPSEAWRPWQPTSADPWGRKWAAHLYRRAAFGASRDDLQEAERLGPQGTLDLLFNGRPHAEEVMETLFDAGCIAAAVDDGGPVKDSFTAENLGRLPYGMSDIVANAIGFTSQPTLDELVDASAQLSRAALLEQSTNSPMLVVNGADDYFIPQSDTLVFTGRTDTEVHLIEGTGHVARSKLDTVMPMMIGWLRRQLTGQAGGPTAL